MEVPLLPYHWPVNKIEEIMKIPPSSTYRAIYLQ